MKRSYRRSIRLALSAAAILSLHLGTAAQSEAASNIRVYSHVKDVPGRTELYAVGYMSTDGAYRQNVVYKREDGTYAKWQDPFTSFYRLDDEDGTILITGSDDPLGGYLFDPESQSIVHTNHYSLSPDGSWGILERSRYQYATAEPPYSSYIAKLHDYYLKNTKTGEITLYRTEQCTFRTAWRDGHTLIEAGYDENARQNTMTLYDPGTGRRTQLLDGTLMAYRDSKILYVKNEPQRLLRVYDLRTSASHLLKDAAGHEYFYPSSPAVKVTLPQGIDPDFLSVEAVPVTESYEYTAEIGGRVVPLPTVFRAEGSRWIPVKPLADALGWKVEMIETSGSPYKASDYKYRIEAGERSVTLTPENSFNTGGRLFLTKGQLETLGYSPLQLVPVID